MNRLVPQAREGVGWLLNRLVPQARELAIGFIDREGRDG